GIDRRHRRLRARSGGRRRRLVRRLGLGLWLRRLRLMLIRMLRLVLLRRHRLVLRLLRLLVLLVLLLLV
ncbi:MAG: hypothetical protein ACRED7_04560, partial [Stellaceae bacterium]